MVYRGLLLAVLLTLPFVGSADALTVSPASGAQGETVHLMLYEPDVIWEPDVQVELGASISAVQTQIMESGVIHTVVQIDIDAELGPRDIWVTDANHNIVGSNIFRVVAAGLPSPMPNSNVVVNPGFETGTMAGWIPSTWSIDTTLPHSGTYDAYDPGGSGGGGGCIRQNFDPIDSNSIKGFTFWIRQPDDAGIAQVAVFHQNGGGVYGVAFSADDDSWTFQDHLNLVLPNDFVVGFHVCGFGGGYSTPDDSWIDDFSLDVTTGTPVEEISWGTLKGITR